MASLYDNVHRSVISEIGRLSLTVVARCACMDGVQFVSVYSFFIFEPVCVIIVVLWCNIIVIIIKWNIKSVIFKCYSYEELIALNSLHEVVPTWYSFHS